MTEQERRDKWTEIYVQLGKETAALAWAKKERERRERMMECSEWCLAGAMAYILGLWCDDD